MLVHHQHFSRLTMQINRCRNIVLKLKLFIYPLSTLYVTFVINDAACIIKYRAPLAGNYSGLDFTSYKFKIEFYFTVAANKAIPYVMKISTVNFSLPKNPYWMCSLASIKINVIIGLIHYIYRPKYIFISILFVNWFCC